MKDFAGVLASILLTVFSWGIYGPVMTEGQSAMGSHLRPFICVGIAYFIIAVLAPVLILRTRGESGRWTAGGIAWSLAAGTLTTIGALGIILALASKGQPIYVMPLVFGGAPVVSTFLTMAMARSYKQAGSLFYAGLILVVVGAVVVLVSKPRPPAAVPVAAAEGGGIAEAPLPGEAVTELTFGDQVKIAAFIGLTVLCWGAYGPLLHKGQSLMAGSRLRPFICVGLAYFAIAVLAPTLVLVAFGEEGQFTFRGTAWSLAGGAAGAMGSLGIILAFTLGGKPLYVMPLVFGGAPVVNTITTILTSSKLGPVGPIFYAGLIIVAAGAATVLVFAPKPTKPTAVPPPVSTAPVRTAG